MPGQGPLDSLLARFLGPVRKIRTILFTRESGKQRLIEDANDETEIGPTGAKETVVSREALFYDCGHYAQDGNLGGRCVCGALICKNCLLLCTSCGAATCPADRTTDEQDGQVYCRLCHDELSHSRRVRKALGIFTSIFVKPKRTG